MASRNFKTALIDADLIVYTAAVVSQDNSTWTPTGSSFDETMDVDVVTTDMKKATQLCNDVLEIIQECTGASELILCFTGSSNYRKDIYPNYKSNRKKVAKPLLLEPLKKSYILDPLTNTLCIEGLEADDLIGLHSDMEDCVICSYDKDMKTLKGHHFDWRTESFDEVDEDDANFNFWKQCLTGDSTDGYSGCPRIGPITAEKILGALPLVGSTDQMAWNIIKDTYRSKGISEEDALVQCQLARILRPGEYNLLRDRVDLWDPA